MMRVTGKTTNKLYKTILGDLIEGEFKNSKDEKQNSC